MPLTLADFWKRCLASGLTDASTPRQWAAAYAQDHQSTPPSDPLELAKWLIATKRLLPFQASSLIHGSPGGIQAAEENNPARIPKLRIAPITQSAATPPEAFPKWLSVTHDDGEPASQRSGQPRAGILWQVDPRRLSPEDGDRLRQFVATRDRGLPTFDLVALPGGPLGSVAVTIPIDQPLDAVGLFAELPDGQSLADAMEAQSRWPIDEIVSLIESLAGPLRTASLSMKPILSADHVWLSRNGSTMLWMDPHEQLPSMQGDAEPSLRRTESRLLYVAPELLGQSASIPTDERSIVYSLGCLGYRLRTGNHAFAAAKDEQIRSRQINFNPPELLEAVQKGAEGEPFFRVLAYALGKDPATRFATVDSLIAALHATIPAEPVAKSKPATAAEALPTKAPSTDRKPTPAKPKPKASATPPQRPNATKPLPAGQANEPPTLETSRVAATSVAQPSVPKPANLKASEPQSQTPEPASPEPQVAQSQTTEPEPSESEDLVTPVARRRPSRRRTTWYVLHSLWIPIFLLIVINALQDPNASRQVAKRVRPAIPAVIPSVTGRRPPPPRPQFDKPPAAPKDNPPTNPRTIQVVENDEMLWAPPSVGKPVSAPEKASFPPTVLLPPGPAAVVTIDYANLMATGLADAFAPEIAPVLDALKKRIGVPIDDVRLIAMAWFPGVDGIPSVAVAVHLKEPQPIQSLSDLWGASEAMGKGGVKLFASEDPDGYAYYPSTLSSNPIFESGDETASGDDSLVAAFAVGTIDQITDVAEVEGAPVLLPRQLEELWDHAEPTDALALLTQPNFLVADARGWVNGLAPPLLDWIRSTLIPECGGILLRVAAADNRASYIEARLASAPGMSPTALRTKIGDRLDQAPNSADDFLVTREVDPSWRLLASRLPTMWAFAGDQTRSMVIDREVVFNSYLPPMALPQLTLATLLASNTTAMTSVAGAEPVGEKLTIEQMLDRPMSVSFGQESMQFAVDNITAEFNDGLPKGNQLPPVEIIGGDLQLMGITQNQQIRDFEKNNVPLRTVLTDLVLGANPDKTATGPDDPKQALVWVVVGEGAETKILITTREASKGKYTLPKEFVAK